MESCNELREVEQRGHEAVSLKNQPWRISDNGTADEVRALFGQLVRASPQNIALTPSTSYAISQAAHNILRSGRVSSGLLGEGYFWMKFL